MKKKLMGIDVAGAWCKNLQKINTIEIFFYVNTSDYFCIEYNFHKIDFEMFKEILEMHKEDVEETKLYIVIGEIEIETNESELKNNKEYFIIRLKSKECNLYRNINTIFFFEDEKGKENMDEMIEKWTYTK